MKQSNRWMSFALALMMMAVSLFAFASCREPEPPAIQTKDLTWPVSVPLPTAEQFIVSLPEGYTVELTDEYSFSAYGTYPVSLTVTDEKGKTFSYTASLTLVNDVTPPTIDGARDLMAYLGGSIAYYTGVTCTDDCDAGVTLTVEKDAVDLKTVGVYGIVYRATDAAGNVTEVHRTVSVYEQEITEQMLYSRLDPILSNIVNNGMTTQKKLRAIYDYVYENVRYTSTSDKSSWVRAAYNGLVSGEGDCFTYFALAKAMMERLGIQNMDIERSPEVVAMVMERHYWSLVNIGSADEPQWYHFDACHLNDITRPWGFLMTDDQLMQYSDRRENVNGISGYFYAYNTNAYPPTATKIITSVYY